MSGADPFGGVLLARHGESVSWPGLFTVGSPCAARLDSEFLRGMRDGQCDEQLAAWEKDYRKRYAAFICDSEAKHPLLSWRIVDW